MRSIPRLPIVLCLALTSAAWGSEPSRPLSEATSLAAFRAGLGIDYVSRTITWDEKGESSLLAYSLCLAAEFEFRKALTLTLLAGASSSDLDGLFFRKLPFSLQYKAGGVTGLVLGAEILTAPLALGGFEIKAQGRVVSSFGAEKNWPLKGLAVEGEAAGKPGWTQISLGPRFSYSGGRNFSPYLSVSASWLSGKFTMSETVEDLKGREEKKIKGKGVVEIGLGADLKFSEKLVFRGEARIFPQKGKTDLGASLKLLYSF